MRALPRFNRKRSLRLDTRRYRERWRIETTFCRLRVRSESHESRANRRVRSMMEAA